LPATRAVGIDAMRKAICFVLFIPPLVASALFYPFAWAVDMLFEATSLLRDFISFCAHSLYQTMGNYSCEQSAKHWKACCYGLLRL